MRLPGLLQKIEQTVKLIRSKGVGVYFVTQNPLDVPDSVLSQMGNRVQHALRAYTPRDQKAVRAAATTFRANPKFDTEKVITELGKGEALVSTSGYQGRADHGWADAGAPTLRPARPDHTRAAQEAASRIHQWQASMTRRWTASRPMKSCRRRQAPVPKRDQQELRKKRRRPRQNGKRLGRKRAAPQSPTDRFVKNMASSVGRQLGTQVPVQSAMLWCVAFSAKPHRRVGGIKPSGPLPAAAPVFSRPGAAPA